MKKLTAYRKSVKELETAFENREALRKEIDEIKRIEVSSSLTIDYTSSDKQFVFAIGLLNSQIASCTELGLESTEYAEKKEKVLKICKLGKELKVIDAHITELVHYKSDVYQLLSNTELFALKVYPVKK
jgi:hypothetical protein